MMEQEASYIPQSLVRGGRNVQGISVDENRHGDAQARLDRKKRVYSPQVPAAYF